MCRVNKTKIQIYHNVDLCLYIYIHIYIWFSINDVALNMISFANQKFTKIIIYKKNHIYIYIFHISICNIYIYIYMLTNCSPWFTRVDHSSVPRLSSSRISAKTPASLTRNSRCPRHVSHGPWENRGKPWKTVENHG